MNNKNEPTIFICQQTGKKYKLTQPLIPQDFGHYKLAILDEITEPRLEVGDWLMWAVSESPKPDDRILSRITYGGNFPVNLYHEDLLEVRKSNGEVWVKQDSVWIKLCGS